MSPRRLRSSMHRVAIMVRVGIHDPRRSRLALWGVVLRAVAASLDTVVIRRPPVDW